MPIYEYVCDDCGHELEALQGLSDELLSECPDCRQAALRRKISAAAFRLKGSGWYETDFKKDNRRNLAGDQNTSGSSEGKSSEGKTADSGSRGDGKAAADPGGGRSNKGSGQAAGGSGT
jgi:putative FmdB family regulatory protein